MTFRFDAGAVRQFIARQITSRLSPTEISRSALLGAAIFVWAIVLWTHLGGAIEGRLAVLVGVGAGLAGTTLLGGVSQRLLAATAACWAAGQLVLADFTTTTIGLVPIDFIESSLGRAAIVLAAGLIGIAPGVAFAASLANGSRLSRSAGLVLGSLAIWGLSIALPLWALSAVIVAGLVVITITANGETQIPTRPTTRPTQLAGDLVLVAAAGLWLGVVLRFIGQWYHWTPTTWASVLASAGVATGLRTRWSAAAWLTLSPALALAGYPLIVRLSLLATSEVHSTTGLVLLRGCLIALLMLPIWTAVFAVCRRGRTGLRVGLATGGAVVGLAAFVPVAPAAALVAVVGLPTTAMSWTPRRLAVAATACCVAIAGVSFGSYQPWALSRLVHSPSALAMTGQGESITTILAADEARLIESHDVPDGSLVAWGMRGFQTAICDDGTALGTLTARPAWGPRLGSDVLSAALPLTLHPNPQTVAIVGIGNGETALTATDFAVPSIRLYDRNETLEFVKRHSGSRSAAWSDSRLETHNIAPRWFAITDSQRADVIVIDVADITSLDAAGWGTTEHSAALKRRLNDGGLCCLRLRSGAVDADTLLMAADSFQSVFAQTHLIEVGPSQWTLIGTDDEQPLINAAFVARLQHDNVRRVLGEAGWDWSVVMDLHTLGPDELDQAITEAGLQRDSIVASKLDRRGGLVAMSRAASKFDSYREFISPLVTRPLASIEDATISRDVEARLADSKERDRILGSAADEFWAYRSSLKDRLKTRPRSAIQQTGYTGELTPQLHPEDERRKAYLATLGLAISEKDGARLNDFIAPYDSLVSVFVHGEAARIHREAGESEQALDHLIAAIFHTHNDMSVAPINQALGCLQIGLDDDLVQYDLAQGLLEQLRRRWHARIAVGDPNLARSDAIRATVDSAKETIASLDTLVANHPALATHWNRRRPLLHRDLVERLRMHQQADQARRLQFEQRRAYLKAERERQAKQ